jgi:hypothetical protein
MTRAAFAIAAFITLGLAGPAWAQSGPLVLITGPEAVLPALPNESLTSRAGVTRGPKITMLSPSGDANVKSPLRLRLKFETFGGAKIDLASVRISYLKNPIVDLTKRLQAATQADGIDVAEAEVPPGVHHIRVNVKDSEGRAGAASFALRVAQ